MDMLNSNKAKKSPWSTADEIAFLRNIGTYSEHTKMTRRALLLGYLCGLEKRNSLEGIDRAKVTTFAEAELKKEVAGGRAPTDMCAN